MTQPRSKSALMRMEVLAILEKNGKKWDRVYIYRKYLNIFEDGVEPFSTEKSNSTP